MLTRLTQTLFPILVVAVLACGGRQRAPAYDVAPVLVNRNEITSAMRAVGAGLEAEVVLLLQIDENGYVRRARVAEGSGDENLDDAAQWIGEQMRFEPARAGGEPVPALIQIPIKFDLVRHATTAPRLRNERDVVSLMINDYGDVRGRCRMRINVGPEGWARQVREEGASDSEVLSACRSVIDQLTFWPAFRGDRRVVSWAVVVLEFAGPESRVYIESTQI